MNFQKIFILGAGAIGSSLGALLSQRNEVSLIGRGAHVAAVDKHGLTLSGSSNGKFLVQADTAIKKIPRDTLILLTTKAYDAASSVAGIEPLLRKDTVILVLQNGLGIKGAVEKAARGRAEVVRGLITAGAESFEPGKVSFWQGETILESTEISEKIARTFDQSGLKTKVSHNIREELWKKLVVNCVVNPLTATLRVRNNEIMVDSLRAIRHKLMQECIAVGQAEGVHFELDLEDRIEQRIARYSNYSSMYQDIIKGKRTEIDFLNVKILELGRTHSIETPVNETMVGLIRFLEVQRG